MKTKRYYLNDLAEFYWEIVDRYRKRVVQHIPKTADNSNRSYAVRRTAWWNRVTKQPQGK